MKGFSFSFVIVFLTITLLSFIGIQKSIISHQRRDIYIRTRITDMNRLFDGIVRDVNKAVDIITKRSISVVVNDVISNGKGASQADQKIEELMVYGTFNGTQEFLMENSTIPDWISRIQAISDQKGYDLVLVVSDIDVKPYDSWNLIVTGNMEVNISEQNGVANISRKVGISNIVSVEGFEDPMYALNTIGRGTNIIESSGGDFTEFILSGSGANSYSSGVSIVTNNSYAGGVANKSQKILVTENAAALSAATINQFKGLVTDSNAPIGVTVPTVANASSLSNIPNNTVILVDGEQGEVWNINNLYEHATGSKYYMSTNGASFLDRMEGKYQVQSKYSSQTNYTIGIESVVDKGYLDDLLLPVDMAKTNVDYIYFSNSSLNGNGVKGLDPSFKIDNSATLGSTRYAVYEVTDLVI
jgi:hypothetical protein